MFLYSIRYRASHQPFYSIALHIKRHLRIVEKVSFRIVKYCVERKGRKTKSCHKLVDLGSQKAAKWTQIAAFPFPIRSPGGLDGPNGRPRTDTRTEPSGLNQHCRILVDVESILGFKMGSQQLNHRDVFQCPKLDLVFIENYRQLDPQREVIWKPNVPTCVQKWVPKTVTILNRFCSQTWSLKHRF